MARSINAMVFCSLFVAAVACSSVAQATILTYNIDTNPGPAKAGNASLVTTHAAYGDNVNSLTAVSGSFLYNYGQGNGFTPGITVAHTLGTNATDQQYYNDGDAVVSPLWKDVNFLIGNNAVFNITFSNAAAPLDSIKVNSFDVFGYSTSLAHSLTWTLRKDSTVGDILASSGGVISLTTSTQGSPYTVITNAPAYQGVVVLQIHHTLGSGGAFGMDNLNFDQIAYVPAPEPSSMMLLGLGALVLVRAKRRHA